MIASIHTELRYLASFAGRVTGPSFEPGNAPCGIDTGELEEIRQQHTLFPLFFLAGGWAQKG